MANNNKSPEDQAALDESLDLLGKVKTVPAYKVAAKGAELYGEQQEFKKDVAGAAVGVLNQMLFDLGAKTYNAAAVPMNLIGGFLGYNPGFSGERFMERLNWGEGLASLGDKPKPRSDTDYPEFPFPVIPGVKLESFAPEGGEFAWNKKEQVEVPSVDTAIKEEKVAPVTEIAAPSYTVSDIDPNIKAHFDEILSLDENIQEAFFKAMPLEQRDALSIYRDSMLDEDYKIRLTKEEGKKKEGYVYNPATDTDVRKNAPNL